MRHAGLAEIERAKADGRWASAYRQAGSETPADLQAAIDGNTAAAAFWPTLGRTQQFKFVFRLGSPEARLDSIDSHRRVRRHARSRRGPAVKGSVLAL